MAQSPLIGTVSGFYTYPKRVGYVKYMPPRCTTLLDVSEEIAEYPDQTPGWEKSLSKNDNIDCTFKPFLEAVQNEYQDNTWGQKEKQDSRVSTRKKQVNTGVFKAVPIAGTDEKLDNYQLFPVVFDGLHEANYDPSYAKKQEENGSPCLISQSGDRLRFLDGDGTDENAALTIRRQYGGAAFFAIDPNAKNGLGVVIAVSQQTEVEIELEWDDNPDTAGTKGTVTIEDKSWTQKGDDGSDVKVLTIGENIGGEGIPLKSKRNRCVEAGLAKGHQDFFDKVQNYIQCGDPFTKKEFKELTEGMSAASAVDKNYKEIQVCTEDDKDITDNKIEPNYEDSADVMKESKTFFCDLGPAYDYSIASLDYMDLAFNNLDTKVPSQTFVEVPQRCSHTDLELFLLRQSISSGRSSVMTHIEILKSLFHLLFRVSGSALQRLISKQFLVHLLLVILGTRVMILVQRIKMSSLETRRLVSDFQKHLTPTSQLSLIGTHIETT